MAKRTFSRRIRNLIAVFRGLPIDTSRSFLKRARPVGDTVTALMKKISVTTIRPEHSLQEHWEMIIGSYLSKIFQLSTSAAALLLPLPPGLPLIPGGQWAHCAHCGPGQAPPNPHVLLYLQPLLGRALVHHSHHAQNAGQFS